MDRFADRRDAGRKLGEKLADLAGRKDLVVLALPRGGGPVYCGAAMKIESSKFDHNGEIPIDHTCEGPDTSPPLDWSDVPAGTKSFVLIVDDPDAPDPRAPKMTWVHWVLLDLPADSRGLVEDASSAKLPAGTRVGLNDWKRATWGGPCPPIGRHRYFFKLYALDRTLKLDRPSKAEVEKAMKGHVLAEAQIIGTYQKKK